MRAFKALALALLAGAPAVQACTLEEIAAVDARPPAWHFSQEKTVAGLSRPLVSSGQLWLHEDGSLVWHIEWPVQATLLIGAEGIRQYDSTGRAGTLIRDPLVLELADLFLSLFNGGLARLEDAFELELACAADGSWTAQLLPSDAGIASLLRSLSLAGSAGIEMLAFEEQRGDATRITLSPAAAVPALGFDLE